MIPVATYFDEQYITEVEILDKIKTSVIEKYKSNMRNLQKQLTEAGVEMELITKIVKPHALAAAKEVKQGNIKNVGSHFQQIIEEMRETPKIRQLAISIFILVIVVSLNTFALLFLLKLGVDIALAMPLTAIFVAPLTEETGKYFSIKQKATGIYFIVFNFVEFTSWLSQLLMMGVSLPAAIISRLLAVLLHYVTTFVQWKSVQGGKDKQGYLLAIAIHALWNLLASLGHILQYIGSRW